jgi:nitrite reductase/ring-hydroxylating ferredoxin subunit
MARQRLCAIDDAPAPGKGAHFDADAEPGIALFNVAGEFYAVEDNCPHMHAPLHDAICARGVITCMWHGWQFELKSGVSLMSDRITVKTYPVTVENGEVYVDV